MSKSPPSASGSNDGHFIWAGGRGYVRPVKPGPTRDMRERKGPCELEGHAVQWVNMTCWHGLQCVRSCAGASTLSFANQEDEGSMTFHLHKQGRGAQCPPFRARGSAPVESNSRQQEAGVAVSLLSPDARYRHICLPYGISV